MKEAQGNYFCIQRGIPPVCHRARAKDITASLVSAWSASENAMMVLVVVLPGMGGRDGRYIVVDGGPCVSRPHHVTELFGEDSVCECVVLVTF